MKIPVSVIIVTKNEEKRIAACLSALSDFAEIVVVDSNSTDNTQSIARDLGARVENFTWNNAYPKKHQWCLDNLEIKNDFVFFVDADEIVTPELINEIRDMSGHDGYFIKGRYVINKRVMKHGLINNKLALFNRHKFTYPVVDDLDLTGMGELEGHYQPVAKEVLSIGQLNAPLLHYACDDWNEWRQRHENYAKWESGMNAKNAWPADPVKWRQILKSLFRRLPLRGVIAFTHCYIWKRGFADGHEGLALAKNRAWYYSKIR